MSVLVDKVGECKESVSLVINTVDECVRKVDECVKKVDGYETVTGICNERVSVCGSHVRDCVRRESMGKLERMLRNEVREEREKRLECEREVRSLERQVRVLVKKMDERERENEKEGRERGARQTGLRRGREKRGLMRCGSDIKNLTREQSEWVCALNNDEDKKKVYKIC